MRPEDFERLREHSLFADISAGAMATLGQGALLQRFPRGTVLFEQGDGPDFLHVLIDGSVELIGVAAGMRETVVEIIEPVDAFISAAVLTGQPYLMTARVVHPARLLLLPADAFRAAIVGDPTLAVTMLSSLSRQYRMLVRQITSLKLRTSTQRLACYLLTLTSQPDGTATFELPYDKRRIAARLGMSPENLSRAFAALRPFGVEVQGNRVTLQNIVGFQQQCEIDHLIDEVECPRSVGADGTASAPVTGASADADRARRGAGSS